MVPLHSVHPVTKRTSRIIAPSNSRGGGDNYRNLGFALLGCLLLGLLMIDRHWFADEERRTIKVLSAITNATVTPTTILPPSITAAATNATTSVTTTSTAPTATAAVPTQHDLAFHHTTSNSNGYSTIGNASDSNNGQQQSTDELPAISTLLSGGWNQMYTNSKGAKGETHSNITNKIQGDVQFLLDFAIVGFGKCGTTTLLRWLQTRNKGTYPSTSSSTRVGPYVCAPANEPEWLNQQQPAQLVQQMYKYALEEQRNRQEGRLTPEEKVWKGFKNPKDIRMTASREMLSRYWPQTPIIVTVRHPVHWMVSIYNFHRIEQGSTQVMDAAKILARGGRNDKGATSDFVSTAKGEFHAMLAELGKTPLASPEWDLLEPWLNASSSRILHPPLPNPMFFLELNQLNDRNQTRTQQLSNDLETFLGLPQNHLPPAPLHVPPKGGGAAKKKKKRPAWRRPGRTGGGGGVRDRGGAPPNPEQLKMNICDAKFAPVLEEMMLISRAASQWFQQYFIQSPEVTVSNPRHLTELLEDWKVNPCDLPEQRRCMLEL